MSCRRLHCQEFNRARATGRENIKIKELINMKIPESIQHELDGWDNGGIDLESWVSLKGNFKLAVGYSAVYWPEFVEFNGYILKGGFSNSSLEGFEKQLSGDRQSIEAVMNHLHIEDIQGVQCKDGSDDKFIYLGSTLKDIYETKLARQFPTKSFHVSFEVPEDPLDLTGYEITFWQLP